MQYYHSPPPQEPSSSSSLCSAATTTPCFVWMIHIYTQQPKDRAKYNAVVTIHAEELDAEEEGNKIEHPGQLHAFCVDMRGEPSDWRILDDLEDRPRPYNLENMLEAQKERLKKNERGDILGIDSVSGLRPEAGIIFSRFLPPLSIYLRLTSPPPTHFSLVSLGAISHAYPSKRTSSSESAGPRPSCNKVSGSSKSRLQVERPSVLPSLRFLSPFPSNLPPSSPWSDGRIIMILTVKTGNCRL